MNYFRFAPRKKPSRWLALCFIAALVSPMPESRAQAAISKEVTIPVILPMTGPAAFLGKQSKLGLDVAAQFANSRGDRIKLAYYDDASNPQVAVQVANQLIAGGARVILGPGLKATCAAVTPLVTKGPVDFCLSPTLHSPPGSYAFSAGTDTWDLDRAVIRYARLRGWKRIAMLISTDASGIDAMQGYHEILKQPENRDMTVVEQATFNPTDASVMAELVRIKAAHPDMLLAWASGTPVATIFRELGELAYDVPVTTGFSNMTYSQMQTMSAYLPKRLFFPVPSAVGSRTADVSLDPKVEAALKDFETAFATAGLKPDAGVLVTWDPLMLVIRAFRDLGPDATSEQLRNYLAHLRGFAGINGMYDFVKFPQRGLSEKNTFITTWVPDLKTWTIVSRSSGRPIDVSSSAR